MERTALRIRIYGDPVLRKRAKPVSSVTQAHRDALSEMARLMYASQGIGLAAPQVGISEAMIVGDAGTGRYKLINPRVTKRQGSQVTEEGCLSVPGVCIKVRRSRKVTIEALDEHGRPQRIEAEDLLACVFQHEIAHLRGELIVDHAAFFERVRIKRRLQELKDRGRDERLSESKAESCKLQL